MPTTTRYAADWTTPATGVRWRLICTPREIATVSHFGNMTAGNLEWGTPPAFGGSSAAGWQMLPAGTISDVQIPEVGFDKLPVGYHAPPTLTFKLHTRDIESTAADLITYCTAPAYESTATEYEPLAAVDTPSIAPISGSWRRVNTTNAWHLLSDGGDSDLAIEDFAVAFIGGHDRDSSIQHEVDTISGDVVLSIKLTHIWWLAAAQVLPHDVAFRSRAAIHEAAIISYERHLIDVHWKGASEHYARVLGHSFTTSDYDEHLMFELADVMAVAVALTQMVLRVWLRLSGATLISTRPEGPYSNLVLREQDGTLAGTARTAGTPPAPEIVGLILSSDSEEDRGGWLSRIGGTTGTIYQWETLDRLFIAASEGCVQKTEVRMQTHESLLLVDYGITDGLADLILSSTEALSAQTLQVGAEALSGADAKIDGVTKDDQSMVEHRLENVRDHNNRTVPVVLHNQPHIGDITVGIWTARRSNFIGALDVNLVGSPLVTMNCLWYRGEFLSGGASAGTAVIRYHHYVGVRDGATTYNEVSNGLGNLPDPGSFSGQSPSWINDNLWYPLRDWMLMAQQQGCVPVAAARRMTTQFGNRQQTMYPTTMDAVEAGLDQLGRRAGAWFASGASLTGKSFHSALPGRPIMVSTSLEEATGRATVKLLGVG